MTPHLLLMRHAKSDWSSAHNHDFERPLNQRGTRDAARMGEWLLENDLVPDRIITSPAMRAQTTAELVAGAVKIPLDKVVENASLYEAGLNTMLYVVEKALISASRPLIIAHNPTVDAVVEFLAADPIPRTGSGKLMTTAAIAVLRVAGDIKEGGCYLEQIARPKEVD